jgi:outer membrane protein assembly factor BamB
MRCWGRCASAAGLAAGLLLGACGEPLGPAPPVALVLSASDTIQVTGGTLSFTAVARDSGGAVVPDVAITWSVSDPGRGQITPSGVFTAGPAAGPVTVQAAVRGTGLAESLAVRVVAPGTVKWTWAAADAGTEFPTLGGPALGPDGTVYVVVIRPPRAQPWFATLVALTPAGVPVWSVPLEGVDHNSPVVTPTGAVLVAGQRVYILEPDGTVRWQALMDANHPGFKSGAIGEGVAFVAHGYHVTALALATGDTLWQSSYAPWSSWLVPPTVVGNDVVYAKHTSDTLFAFRASDGTILRTFLDPDTGVDKRVFGAGTVPVGDRLYLPTWNRLAAFDTAGPLLWLTDWTGNGSPEPAVGPDGALYVQNRRWGLEAIGPDGTTRWYRRRFIPPQGPWAEQPRWTWYGGPALAAGGIIYGAGYDRFFAYDVQGTLLWEHQADSAGVWQAFIGSPAIGPDGTVYTYTATHVYAFWASAPPEPNSPWPMWRHDAQRTGWAR